MRYLALVLVAALMGGCNTTISIKTAPVAATIKVGETLVGPSPVSIRTTDPRHMTDAMNRGLLVEASAPGYKTTRAKILPQSQFMGFQDWPAEKLIVLLPEEQ